LIWSQPDHPFWKGKGLLWKVVVPMFGSPVLGFVAGFLVMSLLFALIVGLSNLGGVYARLVRARRTAGSARAARRQPDGWLSS